MESGTTFVDTVDAVEEEWHYIRTQPPRPLKIFNLPINPPTPPYSPLPEPPPTRFHRAKQVCKHNKRPSSPGHTPWASDCASTATTTAALTPPPSLPLLLLQPWIHDPYEVELDSTASTAQLSLIDITPPPPPATRLRGGNLTPPPPPPAIRLTTIIPPPPTTPPPPAIRRPTYNAFLMAKFLNSLPPPPTTQEELADSYREVYNTPIPPPTPPPPTSREEEIIQWRLRIENFYRRCRRHP